MSQPTDPTTPAPAAPEAPAPAAPATPAPAAADPGAVAAAPAAAAPTATAAAPPVVPPASAAGGAAPPKPAGGRLKPPVVIGAVVGAVALVGGGFALLGGSKDSGGDTRQEVTGPTVPVGLDVLDPTDGPQPAAPVDPQPVPGPSIDPVVVTTTTTTAPPTTVPATPVVDGSAVEVGDGVSVTPAQGWSVGTQDTGYVQLVRDDGGAQAFVSLYDQSLGSTAKEAITNYFVSDVLPYIAELESNAFEELGGMGPGVVSAGEIEYWGVLATQSGNIPVEGWVIVMVRADGSVAIWEEMNEQGIYDQVEPDFRAMLNSIIPTL